LCGRKPAKGALCRLVPHTRTVRITSPRPEPIPANPLKIQARTACENVRPCQRVRSPQPPCQTGKPVFLRVPLRHPWKPEETIGQEETPRSSGNPFTWPTPSSEGEPTDVVILNKIII